MKTIRIFAIAAAAVAVFACKQPSGYEKLVNEAKNDAGVKALKPSAAQVDSVSYLLGVNYGLMFTGQGFFDEMSEIDMDELKKGIEDALKAGQPKQSPNPYQMYVDSTWAEKFKISPYEMNNILRSYLNERVAYKAKFNEVLEQKFLASNRSKSGVKETETGLQYVLHAEGEGENVTTSDTLTIKYKGTLLDGTEFDSNEAFELQLMGANGRKNVIDGWVEGICLLNKGAKATFYIPAKLAYGERSPRGSVITPNSTLVFEVEVLDVKKYQEPAAVEVEEVVE